MSRPPMYEVIYTDLAGQISSGSLQPEDRLPSEAELAAQYGVSRMTVRQALDQLHSEQLLVRRRGSGTYVAQPKPTYRHVNRLGPYHEDLGVEEAAVVTRLRTQEVIVPSEDIRQRLHLKSRQKVIWLLRSRLIEGRTAAIQSSWLPYAVAPGLAREPLVGGSLYRTLREHFGIVLSWAEQEVSATAATAQQSDWLGVPQGSPLIAITRVAYASGPDPIEFARSWTRPEFPLLLRLES